MNPHHLFLGTNRGNMEDKVSKLRQERKLEPEQVLAIRQDSRSSRAIAKDYDVCHQHIASLKSGKRWLHLKGST